ncbi:hypothetical protein [Thermofilum sp.]|uniref:hypothetical protein n=1 Tax=Thermofilum sp. TaxID=1961369 RepID=UPI00317AA233
MGLRYLLTRFKHWAKHDVKVWTYGVGNLDTEDPRYGFLFYDIDTHDPIIYHNVQKLFDEVFGDNFAVFATKHGYLFISLQSLPIATLYTYYKELQYRAPSDYIFSVPLYARLGPKISTKDGSIVSPPPRLYYHQRPPDEIKKIIATRMFPRVFYYTWD